MKFVSRNKIELVGASLLLAAAIAMVGLVSAFPTVAHAQKVGRGIGDFIPVLEIEYEPNYYGLDPTEDVAISPRGNIYVGMNVGGEVYKFDGLGNMSLLADFVEYVDAANVIGLVVDAEENVYVCVWGFIDPAGNGVWRIAPGGSPEHVLPIPAIPGDLYGSIPNSLAFDDDGNLYVTDSGAGAIYRLTPEGESGMWLHNELLLGDFFGANGIEYRRSSLWVANTDRGAVVEVPILDDGSPGTPEIFVEDDLLYGIDGFAFDVLGNMYAVVIYQGTLVRVSRHGDLEVLLTPEDTGGALIVNPTFGFRSDHSTLFITGEFPHLGKVDVGIPGMRLPQFRGRFQH